MTMRALLGPMIVVALLLAGGDAAAQGNPKSLPLAAFFGVFAGSGVAESDDDPAFRTAVRESTVEIRPAEGNGFSVAWSTTSRAGNPSQPKVKTKTTEAVFKSTARVGVFESVKQGSPAAGGDYIWARLFGQTLTVYALTTGEDGRYEMQKWDRTLQGTGMALVYTRLRDGEQVRIVKARLTKEGR